jgi:hypothetical protein
MIGSMTKASGCHEGSTALVSSAYGSGGIQRIKVVSDVEHAKTNTSCFLKHVESNELV